MSEPLCFARFEVLTRSDGSPHILGGSSTMLAYKGRDRDTGNPVMIRVPGTGGQVGPTARMHFMQEAQAMQKVKHPHVARVLQVEDSAADGTFCAMEYCEGPALQECIDSGGPLDWRTAFRLAMQVASAMQALEAQGLVLHAVTPSNMILTTGGTGTAHLMLMDYGRPSAGPALGDTCGATLSVMVEAPAYASPEEFLGAAALDSRSQLYSLGAILWFCLTGAPPFEGTRFEVMSHHVNTMPPWEKLPEMPAAALAVMKRLLAKSADERPATPAQLSAELRQVAGESPAAASAIPAPALIGAASSDGYAILAQTGSDAFGRMWQARDLLTGRLVALRVMAPELVGHSGIALRVQRLVSHLRTLEHPGWQQVLHFDQSGADFRLILEWIDGPGVLALMKARQTLPLREILPLLSGLAEAMDFAAANRVAVVETAPERLLLRVEGWAEMPESERSALLRRPLTTWPAWRAALCPLRLSMSAHDYVLPTENAADEAVARTGADFVRLCYRLLTGHGKGDGAYVPAPSLTPAGNAFFESQLQAGKGVNLPCRQRLRQLCLAEEVPPPAGTVAAEMDPMATLVAPKKKTGTPHASGSATVPDVISTVVLRSLEPRPAPVEREAVNRKAAAQLQAERDRLAKERDAVEQARREVAAQEAERAKRFAEEQARLDEQRRKVEQQERLLQEKLREQQRLEQEVQSRAQSEFQKLQDDARAAETGLRQPQEATGQALRQREADFRSREREALDRLERLRQETRTMAGQVQAGTITLRHHEWAQVRRHQEEAAVGGLVKQKLASDERRLKELNLDLRAREAGTQHAKRRRAVLIGISVLVAIVPALFGIYLIKDLMEERALPGHEQWDAAQPARDQLLQQQQWAGLLHWSISTAAMLAENPEFAGTLKRRQGRLKSDAATAVAGLLEQTSLPQASSEAGRRLLREVEQVKSWSLPPERELLLAKLRMPDAAARGAVAEFLQAYLDAARAHGDFASELSGDFERGLAKFRERLRAGNLPPDAAWQPLLRQVADMRPLQTASQATQFLGEILAEQAQRSGRPEEALRILMENVARVPASSEALRPQAEIIVNQFASLPASRIQTVAGDLKTAGAMWKLPEACLALAVAEQDEAARFEFFRQADQYGGMKARGKLGKALLDMGVRQANSGLMQQGIAKLREAVAAGDAEAMMHLGEACLAGHGLSVDATEALKLARQAQARDHPEGFYLAARALLRQADQTRDPATYAQAASMLDRAVDQSLPGAAWHLYQATYGSSPVRDAARAYAALEKGASAEDANCLHMLGLWINSGSPPAKQDLKRGRDLIEKAAALGHERAREWLRVRP